MTNGGKTGSDPGQVKSLSPLSSLLSLVGRWVLGITTKSLYLNPAPHWPALLGSQLSEYVLSSSNYKSLYLCLPHNFFFFLERGGGESSHLVTHMAKAGMTDPRRLIEWEGGVASEHKLTYSVAGRPSQNITLHSWPNSFLWTWLGLTNLWHLLLKHPPTLASPPSLLSRPLHKQHTRETMIGGRTGS